MIATQGNKSTGKKRAIVKSWSLLFYAALLSFISLNSFANCFNGTTSITKNFVAGQQYSHFVLARLGYNDYRYSPNISGLKFVTGSDGDLEWTPQLSQVRTHNIIITYQGDQPNSIDPGIGVIDPGVVSLDVISRDFTEASGEIALAGDKEQPEATLRQCYATLIVKAPVPPTPPSYPTISGDYHSVNTSYSISVPSVAGADYYELYESTNAGGASLDNYTGIGSLTASETISRSHSNWGHRRYKYKACNGAGQCSGFSKYRQIYVYTSPGTPSSLSISPSTVKENTNYTVSWGGAGGLVPSVGGSVKLYRRVNSGPENSVFSYTGASSRVFSDAPGTYSYRVQACNPGAGCSDSRTASITVTANNQAPVINAISNKTAFRSQQFTYAARATDQDNDNLTFSLTTAPVGMTITTNGVISWAPTTSSPASNNVTVRVSDGRLSDSINFVIDVLNSAPENLQLSPLPVSSIVQGQSISMSASVRDVDNNLSDFKICFDTINSTGNCTVAVECPTANAVNGISCNGNWTPANPGTYYVWARAGDSSGGGRKTSTRILVVNPQNRVPVASVTAPSSGSSHNINNSVRLAASASDPDGEVSKVAFFINGSRVYTTPARSCGSSKGNHYNFEHYWNAPSDRDYSVTVKSYDCSGASGNSSAPVSFTVYTPTPQPPSGISSVTQFTENGDQVTTSNSGNFSVHFSAISGATKYRLYENSTLLSGDIPATSNLKNITNKPGGSYRYCVQAGNNVGWGTVGSAGRCKSINVLREMPGAPRFSPMPVQQTGSYTLSWPDNGANTAYFKLEGKAGTIDSAASWSVLDNHNTSRSRGITNPVTGLYSYQLSACNRDDKCQAGQQLTINTVAPYIELVQQNCGRNCLSLQGIGFDAGAQVTLVNLATGRQLNAGSIEVTTSQSITLTVDQNVLSAAADLGASVTVKNPNGSTSGIVFSTVNPDIRPSLLEASPVFGNNGVIYAGQGNQLLALDAATGLSIAGWPQTVDGTLRATPAIDASNGNIYIGTTNKHLYAFNPQGQQQWRTDIRGGIVSGAVLDEQRLIYVGSLDSALYAFDTSGNIQWQYPLSAGIAQSPTLYGNGFIYVTTVDNQIHVIDRNFLGPYALRWPDIDSSLVRQQLDLSGWQPRQDDVSNGQLYIVGRLFYALLGRAPTERELTFWAYSLINQASLTEIVDSFLLSDDGALNFPADLSNQAFLTRLYNQLFFDNWPELVNGQNYNQWLEQLSQGATRSDIVLALTNSLTYGAMTDPVLNRVFYYLYGFCTQSSGCTFYGDSDGDGLSDQFEWDNGLNPLDPYDGRLGASFLSASEPDVDGKFTLSWEDVSGSSYYQLYQADNDGEFTLLQDKLADTSLALTLVPGRYSFKVKACHVAFCAVEDSNVVSVVIGGGIEITISSPEADKPHVMGESLIAIASLSDDEAAAQVRFSLDGEQWDNAQENVSPYSHNFGDQLLSGQYTLWVMIIDTLGRQVTQTLDFEISGGDTAGNPEQPPVIDVVSAPDNDTVSDTVGLTPGQFRVDESGAATYTMPLSLPDGIAGVTPSLALSYHSSAGNGPLGIGWSINGLSAISRCRQTIEQDGVSAPLTLTNDDRFCYNGQKLLAVSGIYGEDGTEYRTEIVSKMRFMSYGANGPEYFVVQSEDGATTYYGALGSDSNIRDDAVLDIAGVSFSWLQNSVVDNMGNTVSYHYQRDVVDGASNEIVIDHISYSGNTVRFNYHETPKHNTNIRYLFGQQLRSAALLNNIVISNHLGEAVRSYVIDYEDYKNYQQFDRINRIYECDGEEVATSNNCLRPTVFDWHAQSQATYFDGSGDTINLDDDKGFNQIVQVLPVDIDNNGYTDVIYVREDSSDRYSIDIIYNHGGTMGVAVGAGYFSLPADKKVAFTPLDYDGDGVTEVLLHRLSGGVHQWSVLEFNAEYQNCGNYSGFCGLNGSHTSIVNLGLEIAKTDTNVIFADVNSDAYPDMLFYKNDLHVALNNKQGFAQPQQMAITYYNNQSNSNVDDALEPIFIEQKYIDDHQTLFAGILASSDTLNGAGDYTGAENTADTDGLTVTEDSDNPDVNEHQLSQVTLAQAIEQGILTYKSTQPTAQIAVNQLAAESASCCSPGQETTSLFLAKLPAYDFNGDGVADLMIRMTDTYETGDGEYSYRHYLVAYQLNHQNGQYHYTPLGKIPGSDTGIVDSGANPLTDKVMVSDINGDGLGDILYRYSKLTSRWLLYYATGSSTDKAFSAAVTLDISQGATPYSEAAKAGDILNIQFIDVNRDGRNDVVFFNKSGSYKRWQYLAQTNIGFSSATHLSTQYGFGDSDSAFLADWDGDGMLGSARIEFDHNNLVYYKDKLARVEPGNRIHTITNGLGAKTVIDYGQMTDPALYQRGTGAAELDDQSYGRCVIDPLAECSPLFDVISAAHLVKTVTSDAPGYGGDGVTYLPDSTVSVNYHYKNLRIQSGGRGSLGFEFISTYDPQRDVTTTTGYRQDWPYAGIPDRTISYIGNRVDDDFSHVAVSQRLSLAENPLDYLTFDERVFPFIKQSEEHSYRINSANLTSSELTSTTVTDNSYQGSSGYPLLTQTVVTVTDADNGSRMSKTTVNAFEQENIANWWINRVTATTVTHSETGKNTENRRSSFNYRSDNGLLDYTIVEPDGNCDQYLKTQYGYDTVGNQISVTKTSKAGCDAALSFSRSNTVSYDGEGRYMTGSHNAYFTTQTINSRNALGQVTKATGANGVWSATQYGRFGQVFFSHNQTGDWRKSVRRWAANNNFPAISESYSFAQYNTSATKAPVWQYFDKLGRSVASVTEDINGNKIYQYSRFDKLGNTIASSLPRKNSNIAASDFTVNNYDRFDRLSGSATPSGSDITVSYAQNSIMTDTRFSRDGAVVSQSRSEHKNAFGQTLRVTDNLNNDITYVYDVFGNLDTVTGVDGAVIVTTHDKLGRKISMSDPDKGNWQYSYNALGELITQTDGKNQLTTISYDVLGRKVRRTDGSGTADWTYGDRDPGSQHANGLLVRESINGSSSEVQYDQYGRVAIVTQTLDGKVFEQRTTYDQHGRVFQQFDASGGDRGIRYHYKNGYLHKQQEARDGAEGIIYSQNDAMDAFGNVTQFTQGNGARTSNSYNRQTGYLSGIAVNSNGLGIVDNSYQFDDIGNLNSRTRHTLKTGATAQVNGHSHNVQNQQFEYDVLNRLIGINGQQQIRYAANGNISWKFDADNGSAAYYCYSGAGPHAVSGLGNSAGCSSSAYQYDNNGNMTRGRTGSVIYSAFDKATRITSASGETRFAYGASRSRYKRIDTKDGITSTTYYAGNIEVVSKSDSNVITFRRNLPGAISLVRTNGTRDISYLHKDHLGSIDTITDRNGLIKQLLYFDAWGKKVILDNTLLSDSLQQTAVPLTLTQLLEITPRGYTGHETVDHADIIHMNGRTYDPTLGRFMQADPIIQAPGNSQSYNRYSYVVNNPLSLVDPSGYGFLNKLWKGAKGLIGVIVVAVISAYCGTCGAYFAGSLYGAATAGALIGGIGAAVNGGSIFKGALTGAFSAAVFYGIGASFGTSSADNLLAAKHGILDGGVYDFGGLALTSGQIIGQIASHAVAGGVISDLSGGKFGHGFFSAGVTKGIGGRYLPASGNLSNGEIAYGTAVSAAIGGTASVISGGKFSNGARTAAYQYLFNQVAKSIVKDKNSGRSYTKIRKRDVTNRLIYTPTLKSSLIGLDTRASAVWKLGQALLMDVYEVQYVTETVDTLQDYTKSVWYEDSSGKVIEYIGTTTGTDVINTHYNSEVYFYFKNHSNVFQLPENAEFVSPQCFAAKLKGC